MGKRNAVTETVDVRRFWNIRTAAVTTLCAVQLAQGIATITVLSPTYDEPVHLAARYSFLKTGDYRMDTFAHAPLAQVWAALPLLSLLAATLIVRRLWTRERENDGSGNTILLGAMAPASSRNSGRAFPKGPSSSPMMLPAGLRCWPGELKGRVVYGVRERIRRS